MFVYVLSACVVQLDGELVMDGKSGAVKSEGADYGSPSTVVLYGMLDSGESAVITVSDWTLPFYLNIPPHWGEEQIRLVTQFCQRLSTDTNVRVHMGPQSSGWIPDPESGGATPRALKWLRIETVNERIRSSTVKRLQENFWDEHPSLFDDTCETYGCIVGPHAGYMRPVAGSFCDSLQHGWRCVEDRDKPEYQFFETTGTSFCKWVHLIGSAERDPDCAHAKWLVECSVRDWGCQTEHEPPSLPPALKVCSFDIETFLRSGDGFPAVGDLDSRISDIGVCIFDTRGNMISDHSLYVDSSDWDRGYGERYETEHAMLSAFGRLLNDTDCQVLTGYNTSKYDVPMLLEKAASLDQYHPLLISMCKFKQIEGGIRRYTLESAQRGQQTIVVPNWWGWTSIDCFDHVKNQYKLVSYTLNAVAEKFLGAGEQKEPMPYKQMHAALRHDEGTTREMMESIGRYCVQDARLPARIMLKIQAFIDKFEMAALCGISPADVLQRGVQIRVYNMFVRYAHKRGVVVCRRTFRDETPDDGDESYVGATVIEPRVGYWNKTNVTCLDFSSMYPNAMRRYNLDFMTYVAPGMPAGPAATVYTVGGRHTWVQQYEGIIPQMLSEVLASRKQVRRTMDAIQIDGADSDTLCLHATLDARQKSLKVLANSAYGMTGAAAGGVMPLRSLAESTTMLGRQMIDETQELILAHGKFDPIVVYGDTDSVMFTNQLPKEDVEACLNEGDRLAGIINQHFQGEEWMPEHRRNCVKIEVEKCMVNFLILAKKRYAAMYNERGRKPFFYCRGVEVARTDYNKLVRSTQESVLRLLVMQGDPEGAKEFASQTAIRLVKDEVPLDDLVMSSSLKRTESLKAPESLPHWVANDKIRQRAPGSEFQPGERIPYLICEGPESGVAPRAEHVEWVREQGLPIDKEYYMDNLIGPLSRVLEPVCKFNNAEPLFNEAKTALLLRKRRQRSLEDVWGVAGMKAPEVPKKPKRSKPAPHRGPTLAEILAKKNNQ